MRKIFLLFVPVFLFAKTETKLLEDGCTLTYTYNENDLLESISSSDDTICHTFTYDLHGNLLSAKDQKNNVEIRRHISPKGLLLRETFNNRFLIQKIFDKDGKLCRLLIHDAGQILFKYKNNHQLKKIFRIAPTGKKLYTHTFEAYDDHGNLLLETMIFNVGKVAYEWTQNQKIRAITSPYFNQKCMYNRRGELINTTVDGHSTHYVYDSPSHLFLETSKQHLILYPDSDEYGKEFTYIYDRLGRIIEANAETMKILYTYDPLGRKLRKKTFHYDTPTSHKIEEEHYIYDGNKHIATMNANGNLKALRILQPNSTKAVAIELEDKVYVPLSDIHDNVRTLVNPKTKLIVATYDYSYFGKHIFLDNPAPLPFVNVPACLSVSD